MELPFGSLLLWCAWLLLAGGFWGGGQPLRLLTAGLGAVLVLHLLSSRMPSLVPWSVFLLAASAVLPGLLLAVEPLSLTTLAAALGVGLFSLEAAKGIGLDLTLTGGLAVALVARVFGAVGATAPIAALAALIATEPSLLARLGQPFLLATSEDRYQLLAAAVALGFLFDHLRTAPLGRRGRPARV